MLSWGLVTFQDTRESSFFKGLFGPQPGVFANHPSLLSMVDVDTFLTILYVMVDDFCKASLPPESRPGPQAALSRSEVVTLALFGQWQGFGSQDRAA